MPSSLKYYGVRNELELYSFLREVFMFGVSKAEAMENLPDLHIQRIYLDCGELETYSEEFAEEVEKLTLQDKLIPEKYEKFFDELQTDCAKAKLVESHKDVRTLIKAGEQVIIFCYHKTVMDRAAYIYRGLNPVILDGSCSGKEKERIQDLFNDKKINPLICQIKSCVGMNLQKNCSVAVFIEPWLSWVVFEQAIGRIYRTGQNNPCRVYVYFAMDSVDEMIERILRIKKDFIDERREIDSSRQHESE